MASWRTDWKSITDQMAGLFSAAQFYFDSRLIRNTDSGGIGNNILLPHVANLIANLRKFQENHRDSMPKEAADSLRKYLLENWDKFLAFPKTNDPLEEIQFRFVSLKSFCTEMDSLLSDIKTYVLRLTERAFIHLQRLIIVDADTKTKWGNAFDAGETSCEKLGAVHLLWHGIWAFKADAKGERTDLIMGEPIDSYRIEEIGNSAEALVLTEWKIARAVQDIGKQVEQAKRQAKLYSRGCLAGLELADYRYLVLVTKKYFTPPPHILEDGVEYKVVNLAVDPDVPSKALG